MRLQGLWDTLNRLVDLRFPCMLCVPAALTTACRSLLAGASCPLFDTSSSASAVRLAGEVARLRKHTTFLRSHHV